MKLALWMAGLAVILLIGFAIWGDGLETVFSPENASKQLAAAGPWAWAAGLGLLVSDVALPVPGTVVMTALGAVYGALLGGLLAACGSMLAGLTGYGIGFLLGERFARKWLGEAELARGYKSFSHNGGWIIACSRAIPILPEVVTTTAGLVKMPLRVFLPALAAGSLPVGFCFAALGAVGASGGGWAFVVSLLLPVALWAVGRRFFHS